MSPGRSFPDVCCPPVGCLPETRPSIQHNVTASTTDFQVGRRFALKGGREQIRGVAPGRLSQRSAGLLISGSWVRAPQCA